MTLDQLRRHLIGEHGLDPLTVTGQVFGIQSIPAPTFTELERLHDAQPHHAHHTGDVLYTITTNGNGTVYLEKDGHVVAQRDLELDVPDENLDFAARVQDMLVEVEGAAL